MAQKRIKRTDQEWFRATGRSVSRNLRLPDMIILLFRRRSMKCSIKIGFIYMKAGLVIYRLSLIFFEFSHSFLFLL